MRQRKSPLGQLLDRYWVATANKLFDRVRAKRSRTGNPLLEYTVPWVEEQATRSTEALAAKLRVACCPEGDYGKYLSINKKAQHGIPKHNHKDETEKATSEHTVSGAAQALPERKMA